MSSSLELESASPCVSKSLAACTICSQQLREGCCMSAGMVSDVFPRSSQLSDPAVANIDQILLVFSLSQPPFDAEQATRFLVVAEAAEIPAVVVLNKADLIPAEDSEAIVRQASLMIASKAMRAKLAARSVHKGTHRMLSVAHNDCDGPGYDHETLTASASKLLSSMCPDFVDCWALSDLMHDHSPWNS